MSAAGVSGAIAAGLVLGICSPTISMAQISGAAERGGNTIPLMFQGRWEAFLNDCRDPDSVMKITISAKAIDYLGQRRVIITSRQRAANAVDLVVLTTIKGEDSEYKSAPTRDKITLTLKGTGALDMGTGAHLMYRCSP